MRGSRKFPLRFQTPEGQRRLELLRRMNRLDRKGTPKAFTISQLSKEEVSDVRYLWDKDLMAVVKSPPMQFIVTDAGRDLLERDGEQKREGVAA